jgi:hypothetical protein
MGSTFSEFGLHTVDMQGKSVGEVEGKALKCPLLWCCSMMRGTKKFVMVLKGSPLGVCTGEEIKGAVGKLFGIGWR